MAKPVVARQEFGVGAKREFVEEGSGDAMANVEGRITFLRQQVLPVLRDDGGAAAIAADGTRVINGMGIRVCPGKGDAIGESLVSADDQGVVVREGNGVFVVIKYAAERGRSIAARSSDDVELGAFCSIVTNIEHNAFAKSSLHIEVPDLDVGQPEILY